MLCKGMTPKSGMVEAADWQNGGLIRWPIFVGVWAAASSSPLGALDGSRCKRTRQRAQGLGLELLPARMQKQHPDDDRGHAGSGQGNRRGPGQMLDLLTERVGAETKRRRPENGASRIEEEKARPRHAIDAGEERGQDPEERDEAPEEDNFAAVPLE